MATKRHTLLVVDDESDVVKSVKDLLRLDYNVLTATKAAEALKIMQEQEVHIVMSDQRMPGMTGVEFLHTVRGDYPEAIRLLFTGYADIRAVIDAINEGNVYRYVTKPWDPEELHAIIKEAGERYDLICERNQLIKDVQAKNDELEEVIQELREASELKSAFIHVASHELRTPLTIIMGMTDLAIRSADGAEPLNSWLGRIKGAGERLFHLVNQVVSMLAAGKFELELVKEPTDLNELLTSALDDVMPFIELRKQKLERQWSRDLGQIRLEPRSMRDSLNHLLLNAIKFTPDGGTITVKASRLDDGSAEIIVSDTGAGIDQSNLPHLFKPFFTGFRVEHHSSGTFEYGKQGLGLGLSVVKAMVDKHGGTLNVKSELGKGTAFTMRLPV